MKLTRRLTCFVFMMVSPLWAQEPKLHNTLVTSSKPISCLAFSPDGMTLASGCVDGKVRLWNLATDKIIAVLPAPNYVRLVAFSPDGTSLASSSLGNPGRIILWDLATKKEAASIKADNLGSLMVFSCGGKTLLWTDRIGGMSEIDSKSPGQADQTTQKLWDATLNLWDIVAKRNRVLFPICKFNELYRVGGLVCPSAAKVDKSEYYIRFVCSLALSPNGNTLAVGDNKGVVEIWDLATGKHTATVSDNSKSCANSVAFSPDGMTLASACDKTVKFGDIAIGKNTTTLRGHNAEVFSVAFSPDGKTLASCGYEPTVKLWDVATGKNIANMDTGSKAVNQVVFSPDGKTLASAGHDGTIKLWSLPTSDQSKATD